MTALNTAEMDAIAARHPHLLQSSGWKRFRMLLLGLAIGLYLAYSWWFFAIGHVLGNANWSIAGTYLADWVSYEVRPDINVAPDGSMQIEYPRFSPLGNNPDPEWIRLERRTITRTVEVPASAAGQAQKKSSSFSFMAPNAAQGTGAQQQEQQARTESVTCLLYTSPSPRD